MRRIPVLLTLILALIPGAVAGQEPPQAEAEMAAAATSEDDATQDTTTIEDLRKMLEAQATLLDKQAKELERQSDLIAQQQKDLESQRSALQALNTQVDQISLTQDTAPAKTKEMIEAREEIASQELQPETPTEILRAGEFPGSINLPGTNLSAKTGGFVRLGSVTSLDPIGSDDRFIVGSIPPDGSAVAGSTDRQTTISAKRSRMNLDVRMDSTVGQFRAFLEGDFAGDGGTENYRLRHAFGQYKGVLLGKTWSTLMDIAAIPEEVDFEGISAQINTRRPLMRFGALKFIGQSWAVSLEDPQASFTGGTGTGRFWDVAGRTTWTTDRGHLQLGLLLRSLTAQETREDGTAGPEDTDFGYGLSLSGSRRLNRFASDNIKWQVNAGEGIGTYINDLASVGGQDGVFNPETGELDLLSAFSGYTAYQRWWRPNDDDAFWSSLRSTFVYSYVYVDDYDYQPGESYKATQRTSLNLMASPIKQLDLGFEVIWGERRNKDSSSGEAWQYQVVATFRF